MTEEENILIDAIGSVLDRHDNPLQISELVSMLNDGYLEYIGKESVGIVTEENIDQIIKQNEQLFDNIFGVISIKNQKYNSIKNIENEIVEFINNSPQKTIIDVVLCYLLFIRYDAVQDAFALKKLPTGQLNFRTYGEPDRLECSVITSLIDQFSALYGDKSSSEEFRFNNEELINQRLNNLAKIVRQIDWRAHKFSTKLFDELIKNLQKLNRLNYKGKTSIPVELSQFTQSLIDKQPVKKITELHSKFADFISFPSQKINASTEIEISTEEELDAVLSGLRVAVNGYSNISINYYSISHQQKEDSDIVISIPPAGNLPKSFWAEQFETDEIEISSLEELYTRLAIRRLNKGGKAYLILPESFLSSNRKSIKKYREDLTNNGWIDSIIKLPRSWMAPQTVIPFYMVILNLKGVDSPYFFDLIEYQKKNQDKNKDIFQSSSELIREKTLVPNVARSVDYSSILNMNCDLSFHKYINPIHFADEYVRSSSEKISKLSGITQRIKPERHEVSNKYPFINMSELAEDESNFILDLKSAPKKRTYSSKRPLLKEDALLIGTIGGVLKPTVFQYKETPIYLGSNIIALRVDSKTVDKEYLISELNSQFVADQLVKLPKGTTIPNMKKSDLLNIAIRVPNREEQTTIFNDWINSIAKEKIKEIEKLHESIKFIEKEVFSSFAHDFGKMMVKVSSNIDVLKNYIERLSEEGIINLNDSIFFEQKAEMGESVGEVIQRLADNHEKAQQFLQNEVQFFTSNTDDYEKVIDLDKLIIDWAARQDQNNFKINVKDSLSDLIGKASPLGGYMAMGNEQDILTVLNNLLSNAIEHGFTSSEKGNEFVIYFEQNNYDEGRIHYMTLHIGNNGRPFPKDFTCEDFFTLHHKGFNSKGTGKGGYSIKRRLNKMGASISCDSAILSKKTYPVQFEINFKPVAL